MNSEFYAIFILCAISLTCSDAMASRFGIRARIKSMLPKRFSGRSDAELKSGIAKFYDESSAIWLDVWGEHMHHGYYPPDIKVDHKEAQVDMIDRSLDFAYGPEKSPKPTSCVDIGCGVGGSSRHIAKRYPTIKKARGISLSPYQISRATAFTKEQQLSDVVEYKVDDAMKSSFDDNEFDLTWSMESGEHMPDKSQFMSELFRITAPGGRIIIVTWCHRELRAGETELTLKEQKLLNKINDAYYLPDWVPPSTYTTLAKKLGLEDIRTDDWSEFIAPFWPAVFRSALVPRNFIRMLRTGKTTVKGAIATLWMLRGFQKGLVKFALITGRKPAASSTPATSTAAVTNTATATAATSTAVSNTATATAATSTAAVTNTATATAATSTAAVTNTSQRKYDIGNRGAPLSNAQQATNSSSDKKYDLSRKYW